MESKGFVMGEESGDGVELVPTLTRSSNVASAIVPSSNWIVYLLEEVIEERFTSWDVLAAVETRSDSRRGIFLMVPRLASPDEARVMRVPGGNGSETGSVRFR